MKIFQNRKGDLITLTLGVALTIVLVIFAFNALMKQCRSNDDCSKREYCGSDFRCHEFPAEIVPYDYTNAIIGASLIIGLAIVGAAVVLRWPSRKKEEAKEPKADFKDSPQQNLK